MFAFGPDVRPGFKSAAGTAPRIASAWSLSSEHSLLMHLRPGDTLRVDRGTVWLGADGRSDSTEFCEGATHTVSHDAILRMTGIDDPRVTVLSHSPVTVSVRADFGAWRHQPRVSRARRHGWRPLFA